MAGESMSPSTSTLLRKAFAEVQTRPRTALQMLEDGAREATAAADHAEASILAKHAGAVSTGLREFERALSLYELALMGAPQDALLYLAIGNTCEELGRQAEALTAYERCFELASAQGDVETANMAQKARNSMGNDRERS
jgi:tetratricopeptide (TPR) repeat protein